MSTFNGIISEIPGILVDYFERITNQSLYFLSHCHTDHMKGIKSIENGKLIVSEVSAILLRKMYPELVDKLEVIEIGHARLFSNGTGDFLCTAIPAGHCPGSVMFYFQTEEKNILYTGDFRITDRDIGQMKILKEIGTNLHSIYIDSTFLLDHYPEFPTPFDSAKEAVKLIQEWRTKSNKHCVFIKIPARFGLEYFLIEIFRKIREKLFLCEVDSEIYMPFIPEMEEIFETDCDTSRIFVGFNCPQIDNALWRTIKPTAFYWRNWTKNKPIIESDFGKEFHRICYSNHSSHNEIVELINYLKPKTINLNVVPNGTSDPRYKILAQFQTEEEKPKMTATVFQHKLKFDSLPKVDHRYKEIMIVNRLEDYDDDDEVILIPEKRLKL